VDEAVDLSEFARRVSPTERRFEQAPRSQRPQGVGRPTKPGTRGMECDPQGPWRARSK
jgi:hypothetical protein